MPKMQMLSCKVAIGGDITSVVFRGEDTPISFPELLILQNLHGKDAITEIKQVGEEERDSAAERDRLISVYGNAVHQTFPAEYQELPVADFRIRRMINGTTDRPAEADRKVEANLGEYLVRPPEAVREEARLNAADDAPAGVKQPRPRPGSVKRVATPADKPDSDETVKNEDGTDI